jgi:RNA polymerase-binding transcription factor DksA
MEQDILDWLVKDHERLSHEVQELRKKFEAHVHEFDTVNILGSVVTTHTPKKVEPTFEERAEAKCKEELLKRSGTGKCMDCGKEIGADEVICKDCIPF